MSYYKDQLSAFQDTDKVLEVMKKGGQNVKIKYVVFEITNAHPVSPRVIRNWIIDWAELREIKIKDEELMFEEAD